MKDLTFTAIDFETANPDYSSICQIGIVKFVDGQIVKEESQLINPETFFHGMNIHIHGITPEDVLGMPTFVEFFPELHKRINNQVVIHHQPFDYSAYCQACGLYGLEQSNTYWLNNSAVVRRTWDQFRSKGYGLKNVAKHLEIHFKHHDACEDARTAGLIFIEACKITGKSIEQWSKDVKRGRIKEFSKCPSKQKITGDLLKPSFECIENQNNPFYGKKVVISGTYSEWPDRKELARTLKSLGADIDSSVTANTNFLCAGNGVGPSKLNRMQKNIDECRDATILAEEEIIEILVEIQFNPEL